MKVYTDGSSVEGVGGWAWVGEDYTFSKGTVYPATNNQMELQAVIEAIKAKDGTITIVTDSKYVADCFLMKWWTKWIRNDFNRGKIANRELWEVLIPLWRLDRFKIEWTRGHTGTTFNELADKLAGEAAREIPFG